MKSFFKTIAAGAAALMLAIPTTASAGDHGWNGLIRQAQTNKMMTSTGEAGTSTLYSIEGGYGLNSDFNGKAFAVVNPDGTITISVTGGGQSVLGDVVRGAIPAAIGAYGRIEAAKNTAADVVNVSNLNNNNVQANASAGAWANANAAARSRGDTYRFGHRPGPADWR